VSYSRQAEGIRRVSDEASRACLSHAVMSPLIARPELTSLKERTIWLLLDGWLSRRSATIGGCSAAMVACTSGSAAAIRGHRGSG
jgi:hypothetical protein